MIDIKLFNVKDSGDVDFGLSNLGELCVGLEKTVNLWVKFFYNEDCGGVVRLIHDNKLSKSNADFYRMSIASAVYAANEKIKDIQELKHINDDERFKDCVLKSLDIQHRIGLININLEFSTEGSTVSLNL